MAIDKGANCPAIRFRALDSLRGLAALTVVLFHLVQSIPETTRAHYRYFDLPLLMGGRFAVMLFFVLSGFVLALPYFSGTNHSYGPYLPRRAFRLYPPYDFAVLVAALLCLIVGGSPLTVTSSWLSIRWSLPVTPGAVVSHLLMTGTLGGTTLDSPIWSLIIEMRISIIFPLLVLYVRRFKWACVTAALVAAFVCSKSSAALGETSALTAESFAGALLLTGRYVPLFLLGIISVEWLNRIRDFLIRMSVKLHAAVLIGMVLICVILDHMKLTGHAYADVFYGLFAIYLITLCVTFPTLAEQLTGRVCVWLGDISYSLYLIHVPVLLAVFYLLHRLMSVGAMIAVAFPAILLAAHAMHYMVEKPSMTLGRKLAHRFKKHS